MTEKEADILIKRIIKLEKKKNRTISELYELAILQTIFNLLDVVHSKGIILNALNNITNILK